MKIYIKYVCLTLACLMFLGSTAIPVSANSDHAVRELISTENPIYPNPLKGFLIMQNDSEVPFTNDFPYSLEYVRLPVNAVLDENEGVYDWEVVNTALNQAEANGRNVVIRFYMDLPGDNLEVNPYSGIPSYLVEKGGFARLGTVGNNDWNQWVDELKTNPPENEDREILKEIKDKVQAEAVGFEAVIEYEHGEHRGVRPNYFHPEVQKCIIDFVTQFGVVFDGNDQIAAVEAGMLGPWGEWIVSIPGDVVPHMGYVNYSFFQDLIDAYNASFNETFILLREAHSYREADLVGFHNDIFGLGTFDNFAAHLREKRADNQWMDFPIGGELSPLFQTQGFGDRNEQSYFQVSDGSTSERYSINHSDYYSGTLDFKGSAGEEHTSWLLVRESANYHNKELENALTASGLLGYDLTATSVNFQENVSIVEKLAVDVVIKNRGIAPFYYFWDVYMAIMDNEGNEVYHTDSLGWDLRQILPMEEKTFSTQIPMDMLEPGRYRLKLLVPNPMEKGYPLVFANEESEQENGQYTGWLNLGMFEVEEGDLVNPLIPQGFHHVEGTVATGFVIEDDLGNQYVWIPVPSNSPHIVARENASGNYNEMVSSVKENGGFYIGRYEIGNLWGTAGLVVSQAGNIQLGGITWEGVKEKSSELYTDNPQVQSGMLWNEQWDAAVDWFGSDEIAGNFKDVEFQYITSSGETATKGIGTELAIPSGSYEGAAYKNVYDMAGNVWEMTVSAYGEALRRGGGYKQTSDISLTASVSINSSSYGGDIGSRVQFYLTKETRRVEEYIDGVPIPVNFRHTEGSMDSGLVIQDTRGNEFVWVPVDPNAAFLSRDSTFEDYLAMVDSVKQYGGFFIGRYESGEIWNQDTPLVIQQGNTQISGKPISQILEMSDALYADSEIVTSSILWNEQWDAVLDWLSASGLDGNFLDKQFSYLNASGQRVFKERGTGVVIPSGGYEDSAANNIFDLAGNVWEVTRGANGQYYRRGGAYSSNASITNEWTSVEIREETSAGDIGSRVQVFIRTY